MGTWLVLSHDGCTFVERREDLFEEPTGTLPGCGRDRRAAGLPLARRGGARGPPPVPLARLAARPDRADGRGGRAAARGGPARRARAARDASSCSRTSPACCRSRSSLASWACRTPTPRRSIGPRAGWRRCSPGGIRMARIRSRARRPWRRRGCWSRRCSTPSASGVTTRATTRSASSGRRAARWRPTGASRTCSTTPSSCSRAARRRPRSSSATRSTCCSGCRPTSARRPWAIRMRSRRFLEEVLRHTTVVHLRARRATADVELGGVTIRAGERVIAINAAANRDPARWERPGRLRPGTAPAVRPSRVQRGAAPLRRGAPRADGRRPRRSSGCGGRSPTWPRAGADAPAAAPIGFVSRAWRPDPPGPRPGVRRTSARDAGPALSPERAPRSAAGYGSPHPALIGGEVRVSCRPVSSSSQRRRWTVPTQFGNRLVSTRCWTVSPSTS